MHKITAYSVSQMSTINIPHIPFVRNSLLYKLVLYFMYSCI